MATDIDKYLSFILGMFVAFGTAFEVPIVVILLTKIGAVTTEQLKHAHFMSLSARLSLPQSSRRPTLFLRPCLPFR